MVVYIFSAVHVINPKWLSLTQVEQLKRVRARAYRINAGTANPDDRRVTQLLLDIESLLYITVDRRPIIQELSTVWLMEKRLNREQADQVLAVRSRRFRINEGSAEPEEKTEGRLFADVEFLLSLIETLPPCQSESLP